MAVSGAFEHGQGPSKFVRTIKDFETKVRETMSSGILEVLSRIVEIVIKTSPVDTGAFRGNWNVTNGELSFAADKSIVDKDGGATLARAVDQLKGIDFSTDFHVFIANHLPYAVRLEYGWSKQAPSPPGIIRVATLEFENVVFEVFALGGGSESGVPTLSLVSG